MFVSTAHRQLGFIGRFVGAAWLVVLLLGVPVAQAQTGAGAKGAMDLTTAVMQVAKQTIPAVVHIEVTERQTAPNPFSPFEQEPFFRHFFDLPNNMPKQFKREVKGLGTGMLMDAQGHILTNHHVAGGASKIEVLLANGHTYPARLVGTDPKTDLAVIKIEANEAIPSVTFGDSDAVEVGEWVVAIGHPRGLDQTVTHGIISAKHRRGISDPSSYQDFLQTDAAINPGNSGGPLLTLRGEVIGVNAAIASQTGGFEGIGFAIPSNMAVSVAKALIAHGKVERAWLGVSVQDMSSEMARAAGLAERKGALIAEVVKGGPAEQAGLRQGDVVIAYGDKDMEDASALRNAVAVTPIGHEVKVTVLRKGQKQELTVKVQNLAEASKELLKVVEARLGVAVRPVTSQEAARYGLELPQGVAITQVAPGGAMGKAGFEVRDMLLAIDGQPIANAESLAALTAMLKPQQRISVLALDHRSGQTGDIQVVID